MTDDMEAHDEMALAAEYALGLLAPAEEKAIEDVLAVDPELRDHYAMWVENFASLTDDVAPVSPPAALEERIKEALFGPPDKKQSLFARLGSFGPVLAGVAAAAVVLFALSQTNFLQDDGPSFVAEVVSEDASFVVLARFDPGAGMLLMNRTAGGPRTGRALEVWLIADDKPPVSLGVWPMGAPETTMNVPATLIDQMDGGVLAISDEPLGGSQTGAPSGDVLAVGQVTLVL
ncbi:MAG: anti-sigma factor [Yoonia sp.]|nr:anti-sigma factor [Yoonia sp.]